MRLRSGFDYSVFVPSVGICLVLLGVDALGWLVGVRAVGERVVNPVGVGVRSVAAALVEPIQSVRFVMTGPGRIADLEARYAEALVRGERVAELERENESLRTLLGSGALEELVYEPVKTVSVGGEMVLAGGRAVGVRAGESVVDEKNVLLGRVVRVSEWTAWANPVSSPFSKVPVVVGDVNAQGTLLGEGSRGVVEVEQADGVEVGDSVRTSGQGDDVVPGLLIGRVVEVEAASADLYRKVWVELLGKPTDTVYLVRVKPEGER